MRYLVLLAPSKFLVPCAIFIILIFGQPCVVEAVAATGMSYAGLGGDPTQLCVNVPLAILVRSGRDLVREFLRAFWRELPDFSPNTLAKNNDIDAAWSASPSGYCTLIGDLVAHTANSSAHFDIKCSSAQTYLITARSSPAVQIKVAVTNCQDLYGWYAVAVAREPDGSIIQNVDWETHDHLTIRLWIQGRHSKDDSTLSSTGSDIAPSPANADITRAFQRMGLSPRLTTSFRDQFDVFFYCDAAVAPVADSKNGFYVFTCPKTPNDRYGYYKHRLNNASSLPQLGNDSNPSLYRQGSDLQSLRYAPKNLPVDLTYQQKVQVVTSGQPYYFGYTVSSNTLVLSRPKFQFIPPIAGTTLIWAKGTAALRYEPCNSNFIIGISKAGIFYYTTDEFATSAPLTVQLGALTSATVADLHVTKSFIYFLLDDGPLYALNRAVTNGLATLLTPTSTTLTLGKLMGIKVPEWCTSPSNTAARDVFVAWTNEAFVMGTYDDSPTQYFTVSVPPVLLKDGKIIDISLDRTPGRPACFILFNSATLGVFIHYYYNTGGDHNWLGLVAGAVPDPTKTFGGSGVLSTSPYPQARLYSFIHGPPSVAVTLLASIIRVLPDQRRPFKLTNKPITDATAYPSTTAIPTQPILMAQFAQSGSLFFITAMDAAGADNNAKSAHIYLGDANSDWMTIIKEDIQDNWLLRLDRFDQAWLIQMPDGKLKQYLDTTTQIMNLGGDKPPACPYSIFDAQGDDLFYAVDIGATYKVLTTLWFPVANSIMTLADQTKAALSLDVVVSRPLANEPFTDYDMNTTVLEDRQVFGDTVRVVKTIIMQNAYSKGDGLVSIARESPMSTVCIHPSLVTPSCTKRSIRCFFTQATCPAGLSIRLIPQNPCSAAYPATLTIPKTYLGPHGTNQNVSIPSGLMCDAPYYRDPYVPKFGLYYFGNLIENVSVDFYLFEENWRNDFTYNASEKDAQCLRAAQTTTSISECELNPVKVKPSDSYACWGPPNYKSCFTTPTATESGPSEAKNYEILNASGVNAIEFPTDHAAAYVFVAQVLEPNYSFCNLATQFVIMPSGFGDTPDALIPVWMFIASCAGLCLFFWTVYLIYAVSWNENRIGFQMLEKRSVPRAWHLLTTGEHKLLFTGSEARRKVFLPGEVIQGKEKTQ
ncbi:hypothetical protein BV898_13679 [Hypsibius exemplaris]|uniref:CATSPERD/E C-terminal domain-containing protein n=1 Tax=Hypsibius exemplaris TaxID=2072580 RepID=A0A1W0W9Y9_HYPEX|nr:hypothetical protein BV898_13679 [Hypsibius exemplaris]